jgi:hypothetical protein
MRNAVTPTKEGLHKQSSILLTFVAPYDPTHTNATQIHGLRGESMKTKPTAKQINYARILAEELGIEDNYDWPAMASTWTREEVSELIEELLQKREGRRRR